MKAGSEVCSIVRFGKVNLHDEPLAVVGSFDLILCRNVLIYFSVEGRARVVRRLLDHLVPGGYLFLGHAESLTGFDHRLRPCGPSTYRWNEAGRCS